MGYPEHRILAIGQMAEASDETILDFPELANMIREERVKYTEGVVNIILAEAELEVAKESKDDIKIAEAQKKYDAWVQALYQPDLMSLIRMAVLEMKEVHKNSGESIPMPGGIEEVEPYVAPQPSEKFGKV